MSENAKEAPTISDIAFDLGVSVRSLSGGFRRFRSSTPRQFLQECRLNGFRRDLLKNAGQTTVSKVAADWGYVNLGVLASTYRRRYGETPSQTLSRRRYR